MTRTRLLISGLRHYWRSHLAVALGTAVAVAVLAGALIVGDSVRASLRAMTLDRLGEVDYALTGPRFVREALADELSSETVRAVPALMLTGALEAGDDAHRRRAAGVEIIGCDDRLWSLLPAGGLAAPEDDGVVLSPRTAESLKVQVGDEVSLLIELPANIPRDSLLGDREQTVTEVVLKVTAIADETVSIARFGLNPTQQLPRNAWVNLKRLQSELGLAAVARSRTNPVASPARVNAILFHDTQRSDANATSEEVQRLSQKLKDVLTLEDLSLRVVPHAGRASLTLESAQMILDQGLSDTALKTAKTLQRRAFPVLVSLFNEISNQKDPERFSMYGVVAGLDLQGYAPDEAALKGITLPPVGDQPDAIVDVVINDWLASDLQVKAGDLLSVRYHQVGDRGELPELQRTLRVQGIVPLAGPWADRSLTPDVPGITDADTFREWRQPFPMKMDRITDRDEAFWKDHRATPKVFVPLESARTLWSSRYGNTTSIQVLAGAGENVTALANQFGRQFIKELELATTGLLVAPVREQGLAASRGTTDFAGLFVGFSFFLIASAAILVALLFRLGVERRVRELGLLTAIGWTPKALRRHALGEALLVVVIGALVGLPLAVGYAALMIYGLKTWWNAAVGTRFLLLDVQPDKLVIGAVAAVIMAMLAVMWSLRSLGKISPRGLLSGETQAAPTSASVLTTTRRWRTPVICAVLAAVLVGASLAGLIPAVEAFSGISWTAVAFFLSGGLALTAGMTGFSAILRRPAGVERTSLLTPAKLSLRNTARNPGRSSLTSGLVAAAAFLVAAVASGRRDPSSELPVKDSGNGGFLLVAETSTPVLYDLNTEYGRSQLGIDDPDKTWAGLKVVPFRVQPGENASCLNLYQTTLPTILALPDQLVREFAEEGRFRMVGATPAEGWNRLLETDADGTVPVLGDMNTLQYSLHKGVGDVIPLDETGPRKGRELKIRGMFDGSVFQGVLVMAESQFLQLYPERSGSQYFLIQGPETSGLAETRASAAAIGTMLESSLRDYGLDAEPVSDRLADFLAVQNTYLSTFQTLGGLGLLLGVFGVSAVMLRNVFERRSEIALLRAVGWSNARTGLMVVVENLILIGWGLVTGIGSALLAMTPHLTSQGGNPPWGGLAMLCAGVLLAGGLTALLAMRSAVTAPIVPALRDE